MSRNLQNQKPTKVFYVRLLWSKKYCSCRMHESMHRCETIVTCCVCVWKIFGVGNLSKKRRKYFSAIFGDLLLFFLFFGVKGPRKGLTRGGWIQKKRKDSIPFLYIVGRED